MASSDSCSTLVSARSVGGQPITLLLNLHPKRSFKERCSRANGSAVSSDTSCALAALLSDMRTRGHALIQPGSHTPGTPSLGLSSFSSRRRPESVSTQIRRPESTVSPETGHLSPVGLLLSS